MDIGKPQRIIRVEPLREPAKTKPSTPPPAKPSKPETVPAR
jgi:hypothetical protein